MYTHVYVFTCMCIVCTYVYVFVYVYVYVHVYVCVYVYVHMYMCICIYVYAHIYIIFISMYMYTCICRSNVCIMFSSLPSSLPVMAGPRPSPDALKGPAQDLEKKMRSARVILCKRSEFVEEGIDENQHISCCALPQQAVEAEVRDGLLPTFSYARQRNAVAEYRQGYAVAFVVGSTPDTVRHGGM